MMVIVEIIITNEKKTKQTKRNNKIEKQNVPNDSNKIIIITLKKR